MNELYGQWSGFLRFLRQHWKRILLRAHKDRRSLAALLLLLGLIGYCAYYGFLLFKNPLSLVMLGLALFVAWRIRRSHEKEDESLIRLSDYAPVDIEPSDAAVTALRSETIRLWLLLWRASSEHFLGEKTLPEGAEVLTRRVILDKLDSLGLRRELSSKELSLHLTPDGEWSKESVLNNIFRVAELEALQYACGAINILSPIEDFDRLQQINTERIRNATTDTVWRPRETSDIRRERDMAAAFYLRCFGEQLRRGIVQQSLDEEGQKVIREATVSADDHSSDLLIGTKIVSDIENDKLNLATGQAYLRITALQHALSVLESAPEAPPIPAA